MIDIYTMHIGPAIDHTVEYPLLIIETDNWASCEVVGQDTDYEVKKTTTYAWSESISGEWHNVIAFETTTVNDVLLKNLWMICKPNKSAVLS